MNLKVQDISPLRLQFIFCQVITVSFLPYLRVCEGKLPRHVDQVALFRVTLYTQVPVVLHFWWMWPVLVALGLQAHNTNSQST